MFFDWDDALGDYASGYMQAVRDIMDYAQELNVPVESAPEPVGEGFALVQMDAATYVVELEGKAFVTIRYNGEGRGSWVMLGDKGYEKFDTPEQAFAHAVYTFK
jgi:hypothetical protein